MKTIRTITATEMRGINRTAILELIRTSRLTSRSAIARSLGVSMPTVMRIVDGLISEKLVREVDEKEKSGGRKRALIELNSREHLTVGLDIGGTKFYGAIIDLGGEILFERTVSVRNRKGEESFSIINDMIDCLLEEATATGKHLMGIGVGAPGVTLHEQGIVEWAPSLEWRDFPLKDRLQERFHLPVIVDNDVNLSALGEMWFGVGREVNNLILINVGTGIGAGVIIDGVLYRGTHEMAGELGYLIPGREYLFRNYPGFGPLELLAAGTGISQRARELLRSQGDARYSEITAEEVFAACREGQDWAIRLVEETVDYLAMTIAAVVAFFDPEVIALGGGVAQSADLLVDPILHKLEGKVPHVPRLITSTLMHRSAVLGAMIDLLHNSSDFYVVRKLT